MLPTTRPPIWCCSGWRLPRFTRPHLIAGDSSLWPCSSPSSAALTATYSVRALPGILALWSPDFPPLPCGSGDGLAGFGRALYGGLRGGQSRWPARSWPLPARHIELAFGLRPLILCSLRRFVVRAHGNSDCVGGGLKENPLARNFGGIRAGALDETTDQPATAQGR